LGLLDKIKNALFEEEEIEIPVVEEKIVEQPRKVDSLEKRVIERKDELEEPVRVREIKIPKEEISPVKQEQPVRLERSEKTFEFPVFDEEEFQDSKAKGNKNILEYERRAKIEKRLEFTKTESSLEEKKFRPSPIISPVYGVIEGEFRRDAVLPKPAQKESLKNSVDVDMVRNKAFGTLEDEIESTLVEPTKTIDQLLMENTDANVSVEETLGDLITDVDSIDENDSLYEDVPRSVPLSEFNLKDELDTLLDDDQLETYQVNESDSLEIMDSRSSVSEMDRLENETLESDLFNLIDSMYENRKDDN